MLCNLQKELFEVKKKYPITDDAEEKGNISEQVNDMCICNLLSHTCAWFLTIDCTVV